MTPDMLVREWFEQVWTQKREDAIDRLMAVDALIHDLPTPDGTPMRGPAAFKPFHQKRCQARRKRLCQQRQAVLKPGLRHSQCQSLAQLG